MNFKYVQWLLSDVPLVTMLQHLNRVKLHSKKIVTVLLSTFILFHCWVVDTTFCFWKKYLKQKPLLLSHFRFVQYVLPCQEGIPTMSQMTLQLTSHLNTERQEI